jgi:predicted RNase H-like HicB family nuclease
MAFVAHNRTGFTMASLPELRTATYTRGRGRNAFTFVAKLTANMPHGHANFNGMLKKAEGGWRAATLLNPGVWGPVGKTRDHAIRNIIAATFNLFAAYMVEEGRKLAQQAAADAEAARIQRVKDAGPELLAVLERVVPSLNTAAQLMRQYGNLEEAARFDKDEAIARAAIDNAKEVQPPPPLSDRPLGGDR